MAPLRLILCKQSQECMCTWGGIYMLPFNDPIINNEFISFSSCIWIVLLSWNVHRPTLFSFVCVDLLFVDVCRFAKAFPNYRVINLSIFKACYLIINYSIQVSVTYSVSTVVGNLDNITVFRQKYPCPLYLRAGFCHHCHSYVNITLLCRCYTTNN